MSCGLPCVAFDCYGMKEIINHKKDGYLAKPYIIKDYERGIKYITSKKINFSSNREKIIKNYSYEKIKKKYNKFFKAILF